MTTNDITKLLEAKYPLTDQEPWDCSGLLIPNNNTISKILVTLDITPDCANYAIQNKFDMIISHHPLIFQNYYQSYEYIRSIFMYLYEEDIAMYSMHTNYDINNEGMNNKFISNLGYQTQNNNDLLKFFDTNSNIYDKLKEKYPYARIYNYNKDINKVGVLLGAGGSFVEEVVNNNGQMLISSEFKHHEILYAKEHNLTLVDIAHQAENLFIEDIIQYLAHNIDKNITIQGYFDEYNINTF